MSNEVLADGCDMERASRRDASACSDTNRQPAAAAVFRNVSDGVETGLMVLRRAVEMLRRAVSTAPETGVETG